MADTENCQGTQQARTVGAVQDAVLSEGGHGLLLDQLAEKLQGYWQRISNEPQFNPVKQLAFELSRELEAGKLTLDDFAAMIKILSDRALLSRAMNMRTYIGGAAQIDHLGDDQDMVLFRSFVHERAMQNGQLIEFSDFKTLFERPEFGVVFTAHPTFAMSVEMRKLLVELIEEPALAEDAEFCARLEVLPHRPDENLSLESEQAQAQNALSYASQARRKMHRVVIDEARRLYPEQWTELLPNVLTLNSWVGYDLDGRTDIKWYDSLRFRLIEKHDQLSRHKGNIEAVIAALSSDCAAGAQLLGGAIGLIEAELESLLNSIEAFTLESVSPGEISEAANLLTHGAGTALRADIKPLSDLIQGAIGLSKNDEDRLLLLELLAEINAAGLTTSNIHIRINAMQMHNAIRKPLGEGPVDLSSLVSLSKLDQMIKDCEPETVNFACLALERATAVRQFIVMAQILKYVDGHAPIRLLIAECEHALTVLAALYYAKLFDIESKVDISPLFETERAMERGADIVKALLKFESYRDYVKKRGRLAIQTGFSDAGRFFGQVPASLAIERLQRRVASILNNAGMGNIEVVIFNTHGESMGRGAHPTSLKDRFDYVLTPYVRNAYKEKGLKIYHEVSFQGGDGYVFFGSEKLALATMSEFILSGAQPAPSSADMFYNQADFSEDLFEHVKLYQTKLFENKNYQSSLGALETNLLFKTGSRKTKRQFDGGQDNRVAAAKMRAIPHNGLLQQFGFLANVVSGFGSALRYDKEQFATVYENSPRVRNLIAMIARARELSSVKTLVAYATIFNDAFWVTRPIEDMEAPLKVPCLLLSDLLRDDERHDRLMHLATYLREDDIYLHDLFEVLGHQGWQSQADGHERAEIVETDMMHAIRIALIMHIYLLGGRLPVLAARNDITHKDIMNMVLSLRIDDAMDVLRDAYPRALPERADYNVEEKASYMADEGSDFEELNDRLIDPMVDAFELLRRVGVGIGHHYRAYG